MTNEKLKRQAYFAALNGLLAARGNHPDFDNVAGKSSDAYLKLLDHLRSISEIADQMSDIATEGAEFDE
jgi:hypothetical protein